MLRIGCTGSHIKCWGPGGWTMLHAIAHGMPDETLSTPEETWQLLGLLANHLPCPTCASHFRTFLQRREMPRTRSALVSLLNDAHNEVNVRLGKRTYTLEEHTRLFANPVDPVEQHLGIFFIILLAITLILCNNR